MLRKAEKHKKGDWELHKAAKNRCNNMIKSAKRCYNGNLLTDHKNDPRTFWKILNLFFPDPKLKLFSHLSIFQRE